jgi:hypothetical protein
MMGMDVYGNKPKNQCGKYFGISAWGWRPLAIYACEVAPEITAKCKHWYSNDFDGLNGEDSILLADFLQNEIDSGRAERYARLRQSQIELAPNEPCRQCEGTGTRKLRPERGAGDPTKDGIICNSCDGHGRRSPTTSSPSRACRSSCTSCAIAAALKSADVHSSAQPKETKHDTKSGSRG